MCITAKWSIANRYTPHRTKNKKRAMAMKRDFQRDTMWYQEAYPG